ncbi:MAG: hypothetical protein U0992_05355 [Planctomycetaceae bacterium]
MHRALQQLPNDPALHEFRGLVLLRRELVGGGGHHSCRAAGGPGWNWDTMRGLYPNVDVYGVLRAGRNAQFFFPVTGESAAQCKVCARACRRWQVALDAGEAENCA